MACFISDRCTQDCTKRIKVYACEDGTAHYAEATDISVAWTGDATTLQDCDSCTTTKCGYLPVQAIVPTRRTGSESNPLTNVDGDTYNTYADFDYFTDGGTLLGTVTMEVDLTVDDYIAPQAAIAPGNINSMFESTSTNGAAFFSEQASVAFPGQVNGLATINTVRVTAVRTNIAGINGCDEILTHRWRAFDVDNNSHISNMSRMWDSATTNVVGATPPNEVGAGSGRWHFWQQSNYVVDWTSATFNDSVTFDYEQMSSDTFWFQSNALYTAAVSYVEDFDGNIISAETIDGPLPPAQYPNITPV